MKKKWRECTDLEKFEILRVRILEEIRETENELKELTQKLNAIDQVYNLIVKTE